MTAAKTPNVTLPSNPPTVIKHWAVGNGEDVTHEWAGERSEIETEYQNQKATGEGGGNIQELTMTNRQGRATLVTKFGRTGQDLEGHPSDVTVIEELYAVDVLKDISEAPYFSVLLPVGHPLYAAQNAGAKGLPLTNDQVAWVRYCVEQNFTEAEIDLAVVERGVSGATFNFANWTTGMKELRWHLLHGVESYFETAFVLRRSSYGVRTSQIKASFTGINAVCKASTAGRQPIPEFDSRMDDLILSLPAGEWLYKPPQAEHIGRGRWRISEEWQWAEKWSIVYGGTWNLP